MSTGSIVINCTYGSVSLDTVMLVLVYNSTGKIMSKSQVPEDLPPPSISVDIPRGKTGRCSSVWKNLKVVLEDCKSENYSWVESKQGSDEEGTHLAEERLPSDNEKEENVIPDAGL